MSRDGGFQACGGERTVTHCLKCLECDRYARWHVWYQGFSYPPNIGYNSFCDEHMIEDVMNGRAECAVVCIKLVTDQFLPDEDRAKRRA